jgi:DNA-binding NarL/FixJ family response regulator
MIKVAIVEGNRTVRESLETLVNLATGCQCVGAWSSAEEALPKLPQQVPDVVLIDDQLPGWPCVESAARIREVAPQGKILMLMVYEDPERIFRALEAGVGGYLLKRSTPEQIIAAIHSLHGQRDVGRHLAIQNPKNSPLGELVRGLDGAKLAGVSQSMPPPAGGPGHMPKAPREGKSARAKRSRSDQ